MVWGCLFPGKNTFLSNMAQGADFTGAAREGRKGKQIHAEKLKLAGLGSLMEKPQHSRSSACTVEQRGRAIVYS